MTYSENQVPHGPFRTGKPLILASASPRRQALLASLGIHFLVVPCEKPEPPRRPGQTVEDYVRSLARFKAGDIAPRFPEHLVLGADTVVVLDDVVMGKPGSADQAVNMLLALQGREHRVITGVWFMRAEDMTDQGLDVQTRVTMGSFDRDTLEAYVRTGESEDKAGSYAVQGAGGFLVREVCGSASNVIGLPVFETATVLLKLGVIKPARQGEEQKLS